MARHVCEWATRGGERRNTAAYDKGISLGVCRTILGISVNDAGSIFWCARARRLVYSAAQRARRAVSSLAQWQRPRMWIYVAAPHRTTKPSWGGDAQAGLMRISSVSSHKCPRLKVIPKKVNPDRGCCGVCLFCSAKHAKTRGKPHSVRILFPAKNQLTAPRN